MLLEFFGRHKAGVTLLTLGIFCFLCMGLDASVYVNATKSSVWFLASPQVAATEGFFNRFDAMNGRFFHLVRAEAENTLLRQQNAELSKRDVERDALEDENNRLRTLLDLKSAVFPTAIAAEVVSHDLRDGFRTLSINKGKLQGVVMSAAVASGSDKSRLVGRVVDVTDNSSKVLLLTDPLSAISVTVVRSGDMGLLEGANRYQVQLNYLPHLSDVAVGDEVVTAGLGGVFPPHIPVGRITEVRDSKDGFFKQAMVLPYVNVTALRDVLVLERKQKIVEPVKP